MRVGDALCDDDGSIEGAFDGRALEITLGAMEGSKVGIQEGTYVGLSLVGTYDGLINRATDDGMFDELYLV